MSTRTVGVDISITFNFDNIYLKTTQISKEEESEDSQLVSTTISVTPEQRPAVEHRKLTGRCAQWYRDETLFYRCMGSFLFGISIAGYVAVGYNAADKIMVGTYSILATGSLGLAGRIFYNIHKGRDPGNCGCNFTS